jgi:hypothetical protein
VKRDPLYSLAASAALDALENGTDNELYNAVCDAIDLICDHGDSAEARREQLRTTAGNAVWKLAVRTRHDDWVVLWWPDGADAQIYCIGAL